jgi:hypothetical protein
MPSLVYLLVQQPLQQQTSLDYHENRKGAALLFFEPPHFQDIS